LWLQHVVLYSVVLVLKQRVCWLGTT
jgi:hypothetical protein